MSKMDSARLEELLDWLAEEVAARLRPREASATVASPVEGPRHACERQPSAREPLPAPAPGREGVTAVPGAGGRDPETPPAWATEAGPLAAEAADTGPVGTLDGDRPPVAPAERSRRELWPPDSPPGMAAFPSGTGRLLSRLAIGLLVAVILINIPLDARGTALARMIPSSASLVIRNGLLVKDSDKPEVYVYQDGKFRWITDLEAFERYGYQWKNVHEVAPGFLASYEIGRPLSVVAKCQDSPHVYRIKNGVKHWIVDIATFEAEGYQWSDVQTMGCQALAAMPMGETIPPGRGPAPEPW